MRQLFYLAIVLGALGAAVFLFASPYLFKAPSCTDGKQNGTEEGVDCGGSCEKLCVEKLEPLKVVWARSFPVTEGVVDSTAYIENQNRNAGIRKIVYKFSLYDDRNLLVATRVGKTYIGPNGAAAIFEPSVVVGERSPKRTFFEFADAPVWERLTDKALALSLQKSDVTLERATTSPTLSAVIKNPSIYRVGPVEVTVILYDETGNAFAVSRSSIDSIDSDGEGRVVFTWMKPFRENPTRIDLIARTNLFSVRF